MPTTKTEPVWKDAEYATIAKRTNRSLIAAFRPSKESEAEQRGLFLAGERPVPNFSCPKLESTAYKPTTDELESLLADWKDDSPLGRIYQRFLGENFLVNVIADAAKKGDMRLFRRTNQMLGYVPDGKLFRSIVADIRRRAEATLDDTAIRPLANALLDTLPNASEADILLPSEEHVRAAFPAMLALCESLHLPTDVDFDAVWDAYELARVLQASLDTAGATGWSVIVTDEQQRISVSRTDKLAKIPVTRKLHGRDAYAVIAHERLHIERGLRGAASGYYFLQSGTAGYIEGEEGTTLALEQALKGRANRHAREDYYLAIAAANGFVTNGFMTFEQVHRLMRTYYEFVAEEPDRERESTESPEEMAWIQTLRTFRGTDCKGNGAYYGKDIVYAKGNLGIWQLLIEDPSAAQTFMVGKFNPMNPDDVRDLTELGLIAT
ncbi:DUF1704 domain-containing protein [bacterium]|nr:DUF1704 domain-containing protein [bacterium]